MVYCGSVCQRKHWKGHRPFCAPAAPAIVPFGLPQPCRTENAVSDPGDLPLEDEVLDTPGGVDALAELMDRHMRGAAAGNADSKLVLGHALTWRGTVDTFTKGRKLLAEALRMRHPGAAYELGRLSELGSCGMSQDRVKAASLYHAGFAAGRHVGCAVGLHSLAQNGLSVEGLEAATTRLVELVTAPDILNVVATTGSRSRLGDAIWTAAQALEKSTAAAELTGDTARATLLKTQRSRILDIGSEIGDAYIMCEVAMSLIRPEFGGGVVTLSMGRSARGEALCNQVLASTRASRSCKSRASSLLACAAYTAGDIFAARQCYVSAVHVCRGQEGDVDKHALIWLPTFMFRGLGGPVDTPRATEIMRMGCDRQLGPCLELAAQRATRKDVAADLWQRAAAAKMPLAWSIVHGTTYAEAVAAIGGANVVLTKAAKAVGNETISFGRADALSESTTSTTDELVDRLTAKCGACGCVGAISGASDIPTDPTASFTTAEALRLKSVLGEIFGGRCSGKCADLDTADLERRATAAAATAVPVPPCRAPSVPLSYCQGCKRVFYCSKECQARAWPAHKLGCKLWRKDLSEE